MLEFSGGLAQNCANAQLSWSVLGQHKRPHLSSGRALLGLEVPAHEWKSAWPTASSSPETKVSGAASAPPWFPYPAISSYGLHILPVSISEVYDGSKEEILAPEYKSFCKTSIKGKMEEETERS